MLEFLAIKYPTGDSIRVQSVRRQIVDYIDGVRATIGLAVLSQAWLHQQYEALEVYSDLVKNPALSAGDQFYSTIGATFPFSDREDLFLHKVDQEIAFVGAKRSRWNIDDSRLVETEADYDRLTTFLELGDVGIFESKHKWLKDNGFLRLYLEIEGREYFESTFHILSVEPKRTYNGDYTFNSIRVRDIQIEAEGNIFKKREYDIFADRCDRSEEGQCEKAQKIALYLLLLAQELFVSPKNKHYFIDNVSMNAYGMPALMEPEYIDQERDGIVVNRREQEISVIGVQEITLTVVDHYGYTGVKNGAYRAINPETGKVILCYFQRVSKIIDADDHYGQIILQAGYMNPVPNGQCDMVVRQSALVDDLDVREVRIIIEPVGL